MFGRLALLALLCGRITTAVLRDATHWDEVVTKLGYEHQRRHDLRHGLCPLSELFGAPAPDVEGRHNFRRSQGRSEEDLNATFAIEDSAGVRPRMFFQRVPESTARQAIAAR